MTAWVTDPKTLGPWINLPAVGCAVYFDREPVETPALVRAKISELLTGAGIAERELKMVARVGAKWRGFAWSAVDAAIGDPGITSISLLVGTPTEVHLGAGVALRRVHGAPAASWWIAETERWPSDRLAHVGRRWLALAAEHGTPLSGGVLAASNLRNARMEATMVGEANADELFTPAETLFRDRLAGDSPIDRTWSRARRLYPVTLLGPAFVRPGDAELLRAAGARGVDQAGASLIVEADAPLVPAWSPTFLAATVELRRLLWPLTFQNPADAERLGLGPRFAPSPKPYHPSPHVPDHDRHIRKVSALLASERRELDELVARAPARSPSTGQLVPPPVREPPAREPPAAPPSRKRKARNLGDLF
jgi:hypothetical protein